MHNTSRMLCKVKGNWRSAHGRGPHEKDTKAAKEPQWRELNSIEKRIGTQPIQERNRRNKRISTDSAARQGVGTALRNKMAGSTWSLRVAPDWPGSVPVEVYSATDGQYLETAGMVRRDVRRQRDCRQGPGTIVLSPVRVICEVSAGGDSRSLIPSPQNDREAMIEGAPARPSWNIRTPNPFRLQLFWQRNANGIQQAMVEYSTTKGPAECAGINKDCGRFTWREGAPVTEANGEMHRHALNSGLYKAFLLGCAIPVAAATGPGCR